MAQIIWMTKLYVEDVIGLVFSGWMAAMVRSDSRGSHTNTGLQPGLVVVMPTREGLRFQEANEEKL